MQLFDVHAHLHPQRELFVLYDNGGKRSSYTFKDIHQKSLYLAASFLKLGWKRGQRVIMMIPNRIEFLISYMAILRLGVVAILSSLSGKTIEDLSYLLQSTKSQGIVLHASTDESYNRKLMECLDKLFERRKVVLVEEQNAGISDSQYSYYNDLLQAGQHLDMNEVLKEQSQGQMDDPALVMFTSGSTGQVKGVQYANHLIVNGTTTGGILSCKMPLISKEQLRMSHFSR